RRRFHGNANDFPAHGSEDLCRGTTRYGELQDTEHLHHGLAPGRAKTPGRRETLGPAERGRRKRPGYAHDGPGLAEYSSERVGATGRTKTGTCQGSSKDPRPKMT